jgi:hypothetical protein
MLVSGICTRNNADSPLRRVFYCQKKKYCVIISSMELVEARDIDACAWCDRLYFPGDELILAEDGLIHDYHWTNKSLAVEEFVVLKS